MIHKPTVTTLAGLAGLAGLLAMASGLAAQEIIVPAPAGLDREGVLEISGTGFAAHQPVYLLFTTADGVTADIGYALDPAPVADAAGHWSTRWSYGRFVSKKLVAAGTFSLAATGDDLDELATTTVVFR